MKVQNLGQRGIAIVIMLSLVLSGWISITEPAIAAVCRNTGLHQVCIVSIKRSAKNYWEYRASVRIDGMKRPVEVYNCRDRRRLRQDGKVVPFQEKGAGDVICSFFKR